ncbi:MAG: hypothetical protein IRY94_17505 [Rhodospirillaceae bacterium]|nr:hypothetical protein [Rhodospirillaceae bacterium]
MRARLPVAGLVLAALASCGGAAAAAEFGPAVPQPANEDVPPGLAVAYVQLMTRSVEAVEAASGFTPGPPLTGLDYRSGKGRVLTSDWTDGVGARITGLIRLPEAGRYLFAAESNDGVRVYLDGRRIIDDPDVHSDRFSDAAEVVASAPGWYALAVFYFERKNTATLRLHWQRPGREAEPRRGVAARPRTG